MSRLLDINVVLAQIIDHPSGFGERDQGSMLGRTGCILLQDVHFMLREPAG
jgi:hypothetical protein